MKKLFVLAIIAVIAFALSNCAILQKTIEFFNPPYHKIVIELDESRSLVFNAPIDWPVEMDTFESILVFLIFPLVDYAVQGDGYIYEIIFNIETLDIYALTKTPGAFYNFDINKATWYIYINERPVILDRQKSLEHLRGIIKMFQKEATGITI